MATLDQHLQNLTFTSRSMAVLQASRTQKARSRTVVVPRWAP